MQAFPHLLRTEKVTGLVTEDAPGSFQVVDRVAVETEIRLPGKTVGAQGLDVGQVVAEGPNLIGRLAVLQIGRDRL